MNLNPEQIEAQMEEFKDKFIQVILPIHNSVKLHIQGQLIVTHDWNQNHTAFITYNLNNQANLATPLSPLNISFQTNDIEKIITSPNSRILATIHLKSTAPMQQAQLQPQPV